jgi:hypothetical protein
MKWINRRIDSMPARLKEVAESEKEQLIGYGGGRQPEEMRKRDWDQ